MQADAIKPGQTVVVVDDLIATGTLHMGLYWFGLTVTGLQAALLRLLESLSRNLAARSSSTCSLSS